MFQKLKIVFRRYLITGIFILIPIFMSIFFMLFVVNKFDELLIPAKVAEFIGFRIPGLGIILVFLLALLTGAVARNYFGTKILQLNDRLLSAVPIGGTIYNASKQLLTAVRFKESQAFRRVVVIEYPKKDIFSLAFVTSDAKKEFREKIGQDLISVFLPTTPNPTSGFFLMLPEKDAINVNLTVPEAFRLIISAGIVGKNEEATFIGDFPQSEASNGPQKG